MAEEGRDLVLVEVHTQPVHCQFLPRLVDLHQVADGDAGLHAGRWFFQIFFRKGKVKPVNSLKKAEKNIPNSQSLKINLHGFSPAMLIGNFFSDKARREKGT